MLAQESRRWVRETFPGRVLILRTDRSEVVLLVRALLEGGSSWAKVLDRVRVLSDREGWEHEDWRWKFEFLRLVRTGRVLRGPSGYRVADLAKDSEGSEGASYG